MATGTGYWQQWQHSQSHFSRAGVSQVNLVQYYTVKPNLHKSRLVERISTMRTAGNAAPSAPQRQTTIGYDAATGRIATMLANGSNVPFTWSYLPGSDLKSSLAYPNGLTASWTYDANDQLLQVRNATPTDVISQYDYTYDAAGRRIEIARSGTAMSESRTDSYGYNVRNELTSATKTGGPASPEYAYQYDDIGNRITSTDLTTNRTYTANSLNQYSAITTSDSGLQTSSFEPQFDDDGNQTLIQTSTGVWSVQYNGENRPVLWESGATNIVMKFDRMGRRVEYVETVNGVINAHHRFVYDGYLCIQRLNAASNNAIDLVFGWDPSKPIAPRPLILKKYGMYNLFYTHDGNKNVSELVFFSGGSGIAAHYEYAPFGAVTVPTRDTSVTDYDFRTYNPFRFSSEYADDTLGLVYYNYRHNNPLDGRWMSRDPVEDVSQYSFLWNKATDIDVLGLFDKDVHYYYTYLYLEMLRRAGISVGNLAEIARGAQAPDEYSRTSAYIGWIDSQALFHNLNGLDSCGVKCYRDCVYCLISNPTKEINDEFSKGLLLHVLGDTYAHTKEDGSAYPRIIGHSSKGTTPDNVRKQLGKFKQYASDLSRLFGDNKGISETLVKKIEAMLEHKTLKIKTVDAYLFQITYYRVDYTYSLEEILVELSNKLPDDALDIPNPIYKWGYGKENPDVKRIEDVRKN